MTTYAEALQKTKEAFGSVFDIEHKYPPSEENAKMTSLCHTFKAFRGGKSFDLTYWEKDCMDKSNYWNFEVDDVCAFFDIFKEHYLGAHQSKVARLEADLVTLRKEHQEEVYNQQVRYMRTLDFAQDTILKAIKGGYEG